MLDSVRSPADVRAIPAQQLPEFAAEIRRLLIDKVTKSGGHLGPNLGVVELTLALHRVFESPRDRIIWDTGHQAYVHKLLTGRAARFDELRRRGGLSGYPSRDESVHDIVENSHASTALSYADGLAKGYRLAGVTDRAVVAVVGDGALTGGMTWEALNNIAAAKDTPVIVVVNDNGRSYSPTVGGLAGHLAAIRTSRGYERFLETGERLLESAAPLVYGALHGLKKGVKDLVAPQVLFEDLGLKYVGPVDGHDVAAIEKALRQAVQFGGPVIVHCLTRKGNGYRPAETDEADRFHAVGVIDPDTGRPLRTASPSWTAAFGQELVRLAEECPAVVAVTAAMLHPTGLDAFAQRFPDRVFDVGIAEQHAVTSAAGLTMAGLRPVVAVYATFLNRAFDQVLMDVALHRCPVVFVLDRAGVTGDDGPSHNGVWDLSVLRVVPGLRIAAPRDGSTLRRALRESLEQDEAPCVIRFPKGAIGPDIAAVAEIGGVDVLRSGSPSDVLIVSAGAFAPLALAVADRLEALGIGVTVIDPRWLAPMPPGVVSLAREHRLVVTLEDGVRTGGFGSAVGERLSDEDIATPVLSFGAPPRFLAHGTRAEVLAECRLTPQAVACAVVERTSRLLPWPGGTRMEMSDSTS
ncbi:1-deoxy-D-xylulose-5-phosphate synthase [Paractinoplanes rhizophilus]|uniref:1-deoxy-D-xylulose-5-phosphate synthase n=1 Tax=Paractinoplanes rhizophilus TaxID=1416877 RepID=A0ABW2HN63_9ACTN